MSVHFTTFRLKKLWIWLAVIILVVVGLLIYRGRVLARPHAVTTLIASPTHPAITGTVSFRDGVGGTWVTVHVDGLPPYQPGDPPIGPHGFHIHEGTSCEVGDPTNPFQAAGGHFNPDQQPHGNHAGDFPVLFSRSGKARMTFFTNRFTTADIIGRTVIIHLNPDDFRTQPAGDSGIRIACGVIVGQG